jgi:hypothetical protein
VREEALGQRNLGEVVVLGRIPAGKVRRRFNAGWSQGRGWSNVTERRRARLSL